MNVNLSNSLNQVPTVAAPRQEVNAPQLRSTQQKIAQITLAVFSIAASLAVGMGGATVSVHLFKTIIIPSELAMGIFSAMNSICHPVGEKLTLIAFLAFNSITTVWIAPPAIIAAGVVLALPYTPGAMILGLGALPASMMMIKSINYLKSVL